MFCPIIKFSTSNGTEPQHDRTRACEANIGVYRQHFGIILNGVDRV